MHVFTSRGGALASFFGPVCSRPECCGHGAVTLGEGSHVVDHITIADRDDVTLEALTQLCAQFLRQNGWDKSLDAEGIAEVATDMATEVVEVAAEHQPGTSLEPRFDYDAKSGFTSRR